MSQKPAASPRADRLSIGVVMLLIAGVALGLWLAAAVMQGEDQVGRWLVLLVFVLGGLSLVGPPLLLLTAQRRSWGAGRFLWFAHGTAAWLLWPPVIYLRSRGISGNSSTGACFFYGTPLMAVYVTLTLLAGGHLKRSRRRRLRRSWQETFGLLLGLVWACTGLYWISQFYLEDLRK
jgi:hypothetical protein